MQTCFCFNSDMNAGAQMPWPFFESLFSYIKIEKTLMPIMKTSNVQGNYNSYIGLMLRNYLKNIQELKHRWQDTYEDEKITQNWDIREEFKRMERETLPISAGMELGKPKPTCSLALVFTGRAHLQECQALRTVWKSEAWKTYFWCRGLS